MNRWKLIAVVLLIVVALELIWVYAHWSLITTAWKNRATIQAGADVASGLSALPSLVSDIKGIL